MEPGEPFLFKLHSPDDYIVGGGFFARWTKLRASQRRKAAQHPERLRYRAQITDHDAQLHLSAHSELRCVFAQEG